MFDVAMDEQNIRNRMRRLNQNATLHGHVSSALEHFESVNERCFRYLA